MNRQKFMDYERTRKSGKTNMFDIKMVQKLSKPSKEDVLFIMWNYGELREKYPFLTMEGYLTARNE